MIPVMGAMHGTRRRHGSLPSPHATDMPAPMLPQPYPLAEPSYSSLLHALFAPPSS